MATYLLLAAAAHPVLFAIIFAALIAWLVVNAFLRYAAWMDEVIAYHVPRYGSYIPTSAARVRHFDQVDFGADPGTEVYEGTPSLHASYTSPFASSMSNGFEFGCLNPSTGLPMLSDSPGGFDVGGNAYGCSSNSFSNWT
jgi:hypothetical protein